jgi:hypothetical protein
MAGLLKYYSEAMTRGDICTDEGDSGIHDMVLLGTTTVKDVETSMQMYDGMASGALPPPEIYTLDILLKLCLEHKLESFALMLMRDMTKFGIVGDSRCDTHMRNTCSEPYPYIFFISFNCVSAICWPCMCRERWRGS